MHAHPSMHPSHLPVRLPVIIIIKSHQILNTNIQKIEPSVRTQQPNNHIPLQHRLQLQLHI